MYIYINKDTQEVKCIAEKNIVKINSTEVIEFEGDIPKNPTNYKFIKGNFILNTEKVFTQEKEILLQNIQSLADTKTKELKNYIAGKKVTPEQVDRYEQKYQLALKCKESGDYTPLNLEAELQGITGEELADLIIQKHDEWIAELQKYTALIEAYRVKAQTIVESLETLEDVGKAQTLLDKAKEFDVNTTEDEIKTLFEDFE